MSRLLYNSSEQINKCGLYALPVQCNSQCHCIVQLQLKLQETEEETDINQDWQNLKQVILEAAMEFKLSKVEKMLTTGGTMNVREQSKK